MACSNGKQGDKGSTAVAGVLLSLMAFTCFCVLGVKSAEKFLLYFFGEKDIAIVTDVEILSTNICLTLEVPSCNRTFRDCYGYPSDIVRPSEGSRVPIKRFGCKMITYVKSDVPGWALYFSSDLKKLGKFFFLINGLLYGLATLIFGTGAVLSLLISYGIVRSRCKER